jgi:2,3-bisphosphoglycerate-dependent phosphoglycerate mutase
MSVILVRHGESEANAGNPSNVDWLSRLTPKGIDQAQALNGLLPKYEMIITSPFSRAYETAVSAGFFPPIGNTWPVEEFTHLTQTRKPSEREECSNAYWARNDVDYRDGLDAESFTMFLQRVCSVLIALEGKNAIIFTHSGFIKAVYWLVVGGGLDMQAFRNFKHTIAIPNTAIVKLQWNEKWFISAPQVSHLPESERK